MLHTIASIARAATVCAVVIPGIDGLAEFIGHSVGLNTLNDLGDLNPDTLSSIPQGFSHTIADIALTAQHFIQSAAEISANIGNVIGINQLAGKTLEAHDFTEQGGIIIKLMQRFFEYMHLIPETAAHALDESNRGVLFTGTALGVGAIAAAPPQLGSELHDGVVSVTTRVGQMGQHAMTSAQMTGGSFAQKIRGEQLHSASLTSAIHKS